MPKVLAVALALAVGSGGWISSARADDAPPHKGSEGAPRAPTTTRKKGGGGVVAVRGEPQHEGEYQGVTIGTDNLPPRAPKLPVKSGPPRLIWTGFQIKDGVPTLFVELTAQVPYRVVDTAEGVAVHLEGAKSPLRNNVRPLRLGFFDTAITDVTPRQQGKSLVLAVKRRGSGALPHRERWQQAPGGYQLLLVEFPTENSK